MCERGILYTWNDYVDEINARMIDRFPDTAMVFYSFDSVDDDERNNYPQDFLNSITPNGLPPHELRIKINCPLILLHNFDPHNGLCNGTCLVVRVVDKHILDAKIIIGTHAGDRVFIPRILLSLSEDLSLPFKFKRKQFRVRLSWDVHKSANPLMKRACPLFASCNQSMVWRYSSEFQSVDW
jgi:ATP-dependent DNA helicase PIF1